MFKEQIEVSTPAKKDQLCTQDAEFYKESSCSYLSWMIKKVAPLFKFMKACFSDMTSYLTMVNATAKLNVITDLNSVVDPEDAIWMTSILRVFGPWQKEIREKR